MKLILLLNFYFYVVFGKQPNIVLIIADDLGYNDVGYHNPDIITPNIDKVIKLLSKYFSLIC